MTERRTDPTSPSARRAAAWCLLVLAALVLLAGWMVLAQRLAAEFTQAAEARAIAQCLADAQRLDDVLLDAGAAPVPHGSAAWEAAQMRSEALFAAERIVAGLLDADGRVLVHPRLREDAALRFLDVGGRRIDVIGEESFGPLHALGPQLVAGRMRAPDDGIIATRMVDDLRLRLFVFRSQADIDAEVRERLRGWHVMAWSAMVLAGALGAVGNLVVRRRRPGPDDAQAIVPPW